LIIIGFNLLWFLPAVLIFGREFIDHIINIEIADRMTGGGSDLSFGHGIRLAFKNVFFYIPVLAAQFLPWSALCPAAMIVGRKNIEKEKFSVQRRFLIIWIVTGFLIFTAVPAKRNHYVLSLFPALSLYLVSFFNFKLEYIKRMFRALLSLTIGVYFLTVLIVFPYIFMDGVDRLSLKLKNVLEEKEAPVFVSWRLDPQEIELYVDQPVIVIGEGEFTDFQAASEKIGKATPSEGKNGTIFYFMIAREECDRFLGRFLEYWSKIVHSPIIYDELFKDWRWRKTIKFPEFYYNILKNPWSIGSHFNEAFREEVILLNVRTE
jgi:hypothetical protein